MRSHSKSIKTKILAKLAAKNPRRLLAGTWRKKKHMREAKTLVWFMQRLRQQ